MSNWTKCGTLLLFVLHFGGARLEGGSMLPYQAILLEHDWKVARGQARIVIVDMDTGTYTELPVEAPERVDEPILAVDPDGAIYVLFGHAGVDDIGPISVMARLDPAMSEWTNTILRGIGWVVFPTDMDYRSEGTFVASGEEDLVEIDVARQIVQRSRFQFTGGISEGGARAIEIDSSDTITAVARTSVANTSSFFRQTLEEEAAERFDTGVSVRDFVLDSDGSLIGIVPLGIDPFDHQRDTALYRFNFDTKAADLLFENDLLKGASTIEMDPDGRIVALTHPDPSLDRIVRIDLQLGTAEVIAKFERDVTEFDRNILVDMDLRIIPEPSSTVLLILGWVGLVAGGCRLNRG